MWNSLLLRSDFWGCLSTFLTEAPGQLLAASPFQLGAGLRQELSHPVLSLPNKAVSGGNSCRSLLSPGLRAHSSLPQRVTLASLGLRLPQPLAFPPGLASACIWAGKTIPSWLLCQAPILDVSLFPSANSTTMLHGLPLLRPNTTESIRILPAGLYKCRVSSLKTTPTLLILTPASGYPLFTS